MTALLLMGPVAAMPDVPIIPYLFLSPSIYLYSSLWSWFREYSRFWLLSNLAEFREAYDQRLNTEINMIAGYPEPDYATLHNDVLRSLNNRHRLDWIHYRAMAYYDRQAAQSAWDLYQSTNAIMFDRGLKIRSEEKTTGEKESMETSSI